MLGKSTAIADSRVLGDILVCERSSLRSPPHSPEQILDRLKETRPFETAVRAIAMGLQAPFAVDIDNTYFS